MNRKKMRQQRAARKGVYVIRALDGQMGWDIVDSSGPRGLIVTKREAINVATRITAKTIKTRMYGSDVSGQWHRWNCEKVAAPFVDRRPCKCQRLVV